MYARVWLSKESEELTDRQREILQLIVEGRGNKEIADVLRVSVRPLNSIVPAS
jgi:DNA-binding CsgD family transcriptional regulator